MLPAFGRSRLHWAVLIGSGIFLEATALYYQYALNRPPCSLCIHARLWIAALIVVGIAGLLSRQLRPGRLAAGLLTIGIAAGLAQRSWLLLGTERGWHFGTCKNHAGLPNWFALDQWFPAIFGVKDACGRTPELAFGISMAEGLMAFAVLVLIFGATTTIAAALQK